MMPLGELFLCVSLVAVTLQPVLPSGSHVCDDGKYKNEVDLGGRENWECETPFQQIQVFMEPSTQEECTAVTEETSTRCMDVLIEYNDHPPSSGDYRPLRPKYGDYTYLPPQRWLSAIKYGGVAFLYHPCTPKDQVLKLKCLAQSCLWRHIISPYPHLSQDWPLALVSWGCVLRLGWVEEDRVRDWVLQHALLTKEAAEITTNGVYDEDLVENATVITDDDGKEVVCSSSTPHITASPPTHTSTSSQPSESDPSTDHTVSEDGTENVHQDTVESFDHTVVEGGKENTQEKLVSQDICSTPPTPTFCPNSLHVVHHYGTIHHSVGQLYIFLLVTASLVLLVLLTVFAWRLCTARRGVRKPAKYKSVSRFFPFSYGQQSEGGGGIVLPEYGLPKTGQTEREILLNGSDDDEI